MSSNSSPRHGVIAYLLIAVCTAIGFWVFWQGNDIGILRSWFWIGIALAGIYLLTVIAENLDQP